MRNTTTILPPSALPATVRFWQPEDGRVFDGAYSLDTETTLIDMNRPWIIPALVVVGVFDGKTAYLLTRDTVADFLRLHADLQVVMHNAPFDLAVIQQAIGNRFDVYGLVDQGLVRDTQILHRLLRLATTGSAEMNGSSLAACSASYLGLQLDKAGEDEEGAQVRTGFGQYLHAPETISEAHIHYLFSDIEATYRLFEELRRRLARVWREIIATKPFGFVDAQTLRSSWKQHGPLTHDIQLKAAIVLQEVTRNGLHVDKEQLEPLRRQLETEIETLRGELAAHGYRPGSKGCKKALQRILHDIEAKNPEIVFPRTASGYISEAADDLRPYADAVPFLATYLRFTEITKLVSTFLKKMDLGILHPKFDVLKNTGRTSAYGDISAQNLPRDERIRNLFVPAPGRIFVGADYSAVEMATLAQVTLSQFGGQSAMAEAINAGTDLHKLIASRMTGKPENDITKDERQKAKAVNFGLPGGMGVRSLREYARRNYGTELTEQEAVTLYDIWFDTFPEMRDFLGKDDNTTNPGIEIANLLSITETAFAQATGQRPYFSATETGMRGWMARRVFRESTPITKDGRPYSEEERDYFWQRLDSIAERLSTKQQAAVRDRLPSEELANAVQCLAGQESVLTLTGRLRSHTTYCARHNTLFQGLAADGAKLAMWKLWRNGYRIVNFVHDEFLIEIPEQDDATTAAAMVERLMIEGMQEVVPDVQIKVESNISSRWEK